MPFILTGFLFFNWLAFPPEDIRGTGFHIINKWPTPKLNMK
jgi:hypothetical protein